jgi:hypothetical protein
MDGGGISRLWACSSLHGAWMGTKAPVCDYYASSAWRFLFTGTVSQLDSGVRLPRRVWPLHIRRLNTPNRRSTPFLIDETAPLIPRSPGRNPAEHDSRLQRRRWASAIIHHHALLLNPLKPPRTLLDVRGKYRVNYCHALAFHDGHDGHYYLFLLTSGTIPFAIRCCALTLYPYPEGFIW